MGKQGALSRDYKLRDQLRSAAVSAMSNIAEGFARFHQRDFIRFLDISQSSTTEVKSLLYVVIDQQYVSFSRVREVQDLADEVRNMTLGLLKYVDRTLEKKSGAVREPIEPYKQKGSTDKSKDIPEDFINVEVQSEDSLPEHPNT